MEMSYMSYIKSPLNYIGGKYKLLTQLYGIFPTKINKFVDLFAGGFNVGINSNANEIYCNDKCVQLINLYKYFDSHDTETLLNEIDYRIKSLDLSKINERGYLELRDRYNKNRDLLDLYLLICYAFNNQIRFNSKNEFNMPFGKNRSHFNPSMRKNFINFCSALHDKKIVFSDFDYKEFPLENFNKDDLIYCDPPYLNGIAVYNTGWTIDDCIKLLDFLDEANNRHINFALSECFSHKGIINEKLIEWSKQYNVHYVNSNYSNCNYQLKKENKKEKTVEVIITNF